MVFETWSEVAVDLLFVEWGNRRTSSKSQKRNLRLWNQLRELEWGQWTSSRRWQSRRSKWKWSSRTRRIWQASIGIQSWSRVEECILQIVWPRRLSLWQPANRQSNILYCCCFCNILRDWRRRRWYLGKYIRPHGIHPSCLLAIENCSLYRNNSLACSTNGVSEKENSSIDSSQQI